MIEQEFMTVTVRCDYYPCHNPLSTVQGPDVKDVTKQLIDQGWIFKRDGRTFCRADHEIT